MILLFRGLLKSYRSRRENGVKSQQEMESIGLSQDRSRRENGVKSQPASYVPSECIVAEGKRGQVATGRTGGRAGRDRSRRENGSSRNDRRRGGAWIEQKENGSSRNKEPMPRSTIVAEGKTGSSRNFGRLGVVSDRAEGKTGSSRNENGPHLGVEVIVAEGKRGQVATGNPLPRPRLIVAEGKRVKSQQSHCSAADRHRSRRENGVKSQHVDGS